MDSEKCESCGNEMTFVRWSVDGSEEDTNERKILSCRNQDCEKNSKEISVPVKAEKEYLRERSHNYLEGNASTS